MKLIPVPVTVLVLLFACDPSGHESGDQPFEYMGDTLSISDLSLCRAEKRGDTLVLENDMISRKFLWNEGDLISLSLANKISGKTWIMEAEKPDAHFLDSAEASMGKLEVFEIPEGNRSYPCLQADVYTRRGELDIKRSFRIYPACPAIACTYYLKGKPDPAWSGEYLHIRENRGHKRENEIRSVSTVSPVMERLCFQEIHWNASSMDFLQNTDYNNTLVRTQHEPAFVDADAKENRLRGTLLLARESLGGEGFFILKQAPPVDDQLAYPGMDFINTAGEFQVVGTGILPAEILENQWRRCYGFVTGVAGGSRLEGMMAIRNYLNRLRLHKEGRDEMVLMNTWGDRSRGAKLNEAFCLAEIEAGHRLGITHFQLDAGWDESMEPGREGFFAIDAGKFPNGFDPLLKRCDELGMELCLWTRPGTDYTYASWEVFADSVISMYDRYGIRTYKFDGVHIWNRTAEERVLAIFDKVMKETGDDAVFNLDITMGARWGYHYFNEYGNLFVENRYTDWKNYYPHWTLRNLWMLSAYIPPQHLQMEFLNKWRSLDQYREGDPFAPKNVPFDYLFATTLMSQPLAWFEASELPMKAFEIAPMVNKYTSIMGDIHSGYIFPVGEEPSGTAWTGFQSIKGDEGYLLVFREFNDRGETDLKTWFPPGVKVSFTHLFGHGKDFTARVNDFEEVTLSLPEAFTFALYEYAIVTME